MVAVSRVTIAVWVVPPSIRYWICSTPAEPSPASVPVSLTVTAPWYQPSAVRRVGDTISASVVGADLSFGNWSAAEMSSVSNSPPAVSAVSDIR